MSIRLVIDGNAVYEIDEDCEVCRRNKEKEEERQIQNAGGKYGKETENINGLPAEKRPLDAGGEAGFRKEPF